MTPATVIGWDIGGAHVKACLMERGRVVDVAQWACPLWQGMAHLDAALAQAAERWPGCAGAAHAVTMTGEMVDLFADREAGVRRIADCLASTWPGQVSFFAGEQGWCDAAAVPAQWQHIASANWIATACHVALWAQTRAPGVGDRAPVAGAAPPAHRRAAANAMNPMNRANGANGANVTDEPDATCGVLIDIGSTTTDLIAFRGGRVLSASRSDAQRLATGELVYQGVVRTPLCALAPRVPLHGTVFNVMNEFFATTADAYRLTGELDPGHDLHPSADGAAKTESATRQRLARMVGLDARDASAGEWLEFARAWRQAQVAEIAGQLRRVTLSHGLPPSAMVVSAGCGAFLVPSVLTAAGMDGRGGLHAYGDAVTPVAAGATDRVAGWAQVCAPSVAVAALFARDGAPAWALA